MEHIHGFISGAIEVIPVVWCQLQRRHARVVMGNTLSVSLDELYANSSAAPHLHNGIN